MQTDQGGKLSNAAESIFLWTECFLGNSSYFTSRATKPHTSILFGENGVNPKGDGWTQPTLEKQHGFKIDAS